MIIRRILTLFSKNILVLRRGNTATALIPIRRLIGLFNNLHLRGKMILTFLLFGFIPLLIVSIFQLNAVVDVLKKEVEEAAADSLNEMGQRIEERFDMYNRIANTIVYDTYLNKALNNPYNRLSDAIDLYYYVWNQANSIIRDNPDIKYITIYTPNPDLVTLSPYLVRISKIEDMEEYALIKNSQVFPYIGGVRNVARRGDYWMDTESGEGEPHFSLNRIIIQHSIYMRQTGILTMSISEMSLRSLISSGDSNSFYFIADQEGRIVTASNSNLSGESVFSLVSGEAWNTAVNSGTYIVDTGNDKRLLVRALQSEWFLATIISMRDVQASTRSIQYMGIAVVSLCALSSVILVIIISSATARRFNLLLNKMKASKSGIPEPGSPIEGRDEISLLDKGFREMTVNLNNVIHELYQVDFEKKEAQLQALQSRINPHFLYNTLSSIGWMTRTHTPAQVREAIETLATYYRATLSGGKDIITLGEELTGLRSYLAIQHLRGGGRVRAVITIDSMLEGIMLPKMTLQPIVENCIEHGINLESQCISIYITSSVTNSDALIHISDDGSGIDAATLERIRAGSIRSSSGGYGIHNVQMRLKMHFGDAYGLDIENLPERGVRVTIRIPLCEGC